MNSMSILWVWLSSLLFALVHSLMATTRIKAFLFELGVGGQAYRLAYSLLALMLTALWLWFVHALPDAPLYHLAGWRNVLLVIVQLAGLAIVLLSFRSFDGGMFLGFKPWPDQGEPFHETGIYRWLRHPMYSGVMLALLASPMQTVNSLHLSLAICLYFIIGAQFEERRMLAEHPAYADYRRRVPGFIPHVIPKGPGSRL